MKARPRLLAFTTSYFPDVGGVEVALRQVAERLTSDFDISIVTARLRSDRPTTEILREGRLRRLGIARGVDKWLLPPLAVLSSRRLVDSSNNGRRTLLWGLDIAQGSLAAAWIQRSQPSTPFVLTIQYGEGPERVAKGRLGLIRRAFRTMLSRATRVTAISSPLAALAAAHGYTRPVDLIPNGVDLELFRRRGPPPSGPTPTVVTVSRLVKKNGIDSLLRAMALLIRRHKGLQCRILGDGPERSKLERLAAELGLGSAVSFCGNIPHRDVPKHLWESAVFVRPSRTEGMGNAFIEALAAELPVVATPVGGVPDIIQDGETGLLTAVDRPQELADRIERLLVDSHLAARLARQGLALVRERYDIDLVARRYAGLFGELLGA